MKGRKIKIEFDLLELLSQFIEDSRRGKRTSDGIKKMSPHTISNYTSLLELLKKFSGKYQFALRLRRANKLNARESEVEENYWKRFYRKFTNYLYDDLDFYDNYVGVQMKILRSCFNHINTELKIDTANVQRLFKARSEEIDIVVLSPEQLNHLILSEELDAKLPDRLKKIKDVFIFGCTVALRQSDLMRLSPANLFRLNGKVYLKIRSKKTETLTKVSLPQYAVKIIEKYKKKNNYKSLLPYYHKVYLNKYIKEMLEIAGFTEPFERTRMKRGRSVIIYKDKRKRIPFRFCDMVTSHTMRKTAITTMLSLGMNELAVRNISGHSANSKEFYRYVRFSQSYSDLQLESVHEKLSTKRLETV